MKRRLIFLGLVVGVLLPAAAVLTACGGDGSADSSPAVTDDGAASPTAAAADPAADGAGVRMVEEAGDPRTAWKFDPAQLTVAQGTSVTFTNTGHEVHTATADGGSFDTGVISAGGTQSVVFADAGTFSFHCSLHPWMKAEIVVTESR